MMIFFINKVSHEVHRSICEHMTNPNVVILGNFNSVHQAVAAALSAGYYDANGCFYCCPESHKK